MLAAAAESHLRQEGRCRAGSTGRAKKATCGSKAGAGQSEMAGPSCDAPAGWLGWVQPWAKSLAGKAECKAASGFTYTPHDGGCGAAAAVLPFRQPQQGLSIHRRPSHSHGRSLADISETSGGAAAHDGGGGAVAAVILDDLHLAVLPHAHAAAQGEAEACMRGSLWKRQSEFGAIAKASNNP